MSVNLSPVGNGFQFFSNDGLPLSGGKLQTYQAGSTTPLATYTDNSGLIANTNPIIFGTSGRPPADIWLLDGFFYKFVLSDANDVVIQTYDNLYGITGVAPVPPTPLPSGSIILWSGSIGSIPSGFVLCNGSNGTPDLRDRFVVGAGTTYAVDAFGGSANAVVVSHSHTVSGTTGGAGGHSHTWPYDGMIGTSPGGGSFALGSTFPQDTSAVGDHDHSFSATSSTAGVSGTNANLPPYYALCYIMKT
jgi:hypothetical protein